MSSNHKIVKYEGGSLISKVSAETLEACTASFDLKAVAVAKSRNLPPDWASFVEKVNQCKALRDIMHKQSHGVMEMAQETETPLCELIDRALTTAILFGLEIAQAMSESTELDKLLIN